MSVPSTLLISQAGTPTSAVARVRELLVSLTGFLALGAAAGLGTGNWQLAIKMVPTALLDVSGALLLSTPALLVVHQFLDLRAKPEHLISAIATGIARTGNLAWGLAWVVMFFAATSSLWLVALLASMAGLAVVAFVLCRDGLHAAEAQACAQQAPPSAGSPTGSAGALANVSPKFSLLVFGWLALTVLIALRLGFDLGAFVLQHTH